MANQRPLAEPASPSNTIAARSRGVTMQPNVPFRLIEVLATARVGTVWAGVDPAGRQLTVAVLDEGVAVEPDWRTAFETAVRTMTQPDGGPMPVVGADFAAAAPWVAVLADGGPGAARAFQN